jgi:hypothetical protein
VERKWRPLETETSYGGAGTYELRMVHTVRGKTEPVPIPRFLRCDNRGLLLIGVTTRIETRRKQFICGVERCYGHSEGNLLHLLTRYTRLTKLFPDYQLEFRYHPATGQREAELAEEQSIKRYVRRFGEVPPLNSAIPNRYTNWGQKNSKGRN